MTEHTDQESRPQDAGPRLRCPSCSFMVPLPAEICPRCQTNLRTGQGPPPAGDDDEGPRRGRLVLIGLLLLLIIGLAVVFFSGAFESPKPIKAGPAPTQPKDGLSDAVDAFHGLSDQSIGAQPGYILERSRDTADQVENKWREVEGANSSYPDPNKKDGDD